MKSLSSFIVILLLAACVPWKKELSSKGDYNDAVENAIIDFINTSNLYKKDSLFTIYFDTIGQEVLGVNIYGDINALQVAWKDSLLLTNGLPTNYYIHQNKLFYWHDPNRKLSKETVEVLKMYTRIDTGIVNVYIPEYTINHTKKGVDYYFCMDDLTTYKKVKTKLAMGYYNPPKLKCK